MTAPVFTTYARCAVPDCQWGRCTRTDDLDVATGDAIDWAEHALTAHALVEHKRGLVRGPGVMWRGEIRSIRGWARVRGINWSTLCGRLQAGWDLEEAMTTPAGERR